MTAAGHVRQVMEDTGVYAFTGDNPLDWELAAYAAGFALVEEALQGLEQELFAATAPAERLEQWERLFRCQEGFGDLEGRRLGMVQSLAAHNGPASLAGVEEMVAAAGVKGTVSETDGKLVIAVEGYQGVTAKEARRLLDRYLPAHIEWELA